jgi:cysteine synthase
MDYALTTEAPDRRSALLDLVGNTPMLRLARVAPELAPGVELYAKAEWYNPGGSVKDRPALYMIRDGERSGRLRPGIRIADATSGNTGIAYATLGAALGYGVTLALPANASPERKRILRALGAELILTDPLEGMDQAIRSIRALVAESARWWPSTPSAISTPTSTTTRPTSNRTTRPPAPRSGRRPMGASRTLSRRSAPAAPLSAPGGGCAPSRRMCGW